MDFTPGIFDILIERGTGRPRRLEESRIRTTLAKQLALYVVLYSPLQMAADLPENYEGKPAFQFIRDVAVDWETTQDDRRKDRRLRDRRAQGARTATTGSSARSRTRRRARSTCRCRSCTPGKRYVAEIYADGPGANWATNPLPVAISKRSVDSTTRLRCRARAGRGAGGSDHAGASELSADCN